jgi:AcrR family transcriptional regulator
MADKASTRRRLEPEARRQEILATTVRLISDDGYRGLTLAQIAKACGMTNAGLLHHFPSKAALLTAVLDHVGYSPKPTSEPYATSPQACRTGLDRTVASNLERRELVRFYAVLNVEALSSDHPAHDYFTRRMAWAHSELVKAATPWHPQPDAFAVEVVAVISGLQLAWLQDPGTDLMGSWNTFADRLFAPFLPEPDATDHAEP